MATRTQPQRSSGRRLRAAAVRQRKRGWLLGGVAAVIVVAVAVVASVTGGGSGGSSSAVAVNGSPAVGVGGVAPGFSMPTVSGSSFQFPTQRPTLLYFMAGWCGTCVPEAQALARTAPSVRAHADLVAVDVDPSDSWSSLRSFFTNVGSPGYTFAKDDGQVGRAFGINSLDITIGIDAVGHVAYRHLGGLDDTGVRSALAKIGVSG
jgi:thiol-disulfide isomerase/thioredoxin